MDPFLSPFFSIGNLFVSWYWSDNACHSLSFAPVSYSGNDAIIYTFFEWVDRVAIVTINRWMDKSVSLSNASIRLWCVSSSNVARGGTWLDVLVNSRVCDWFMVIGAIKPCLFYHLLYFFVFANIFRGMVRWCSAPLFKVIILGTHKLTSMWTQNWRLWCKTKTVKTNGHNF